jgi:hypothetical protein
VCRKPDESQAQFSAISTIATQIEALIEIQRVRNMSLLGESLEVIQETASVILAALEPPAQVGAEDRVEEPEPADIAA